jgi:hypothetical protein
MSVITILKIIIVIWIGRDKKEGRKERKKERKKEKEKLFFGMG